MKQLDKNTQLFMEMIKLLMKGVNKNDNTGKC